MEPKSDSDELRYALRRAAIRNRQHLRTQPERITDDGLIIPQTTAIPSPEHYHILYHVPKDDITIVHWAEPLASSREGYERIAQMARGAEPNTEWYENGSVGFETTLHGRADLWWIVCEVAACIKARCSKTLQRQGLKKRLILIPGDEEKA